MKNRRYRKMFISLLAAALCLSAPAYGQVSKADFEIVSKEFKGAYTASLDLLKLKAADTPPKQRLKTVLDSLLYNGATAEAYMSKWEQEISGKSNKSYYEKLKLDVIGKYLHIERSTSACGASCSDDMKVYIINTQTQKRLSHNDLFVAAKNADLTKLLKKHLKSGEPVDEKELDKSLKDKAYEVSFEKEGVGFHWNKYQIAVGAAGRFDIVIPRAEIEPYLTPVGRELLKKEQ
jgi:(2Fe-2S) ferredoxin